eukprot:9703991-Alexandrium_andersonii.AAC.1
MSRWPVLRLSRKQYDLADFLAGPIVSSSRGLESSRLRVCHKERKARGHLKLADRGALARRRRG